MRAAVFEGGGRLEVKERHDPWPGPGEVLIEVEACGVCGSDLQIINVPAGHPSTPPVILGHEFVGQVRELGSDIPAGGPQIGDRVVADPDPKCGACASCRAGRPSTCENIVALGVHRDGALAQYVTVPANCAYPIAADVSAEMAALVEPLACVVNGTNLAALRPGEPVVVFGGGAIGCLFMAVFKAAGASRIVAIEPTAQRGAIARAIGADDVFTPADWAERRQDVMPGGAAVVVDAVGSVLPDAIRAASMGGRVVVFGMNGNANPPVHQVEIVEKGLTIHGSYISNFTFPAAIRLVESRTLNLSPMISSVIPLEDTVAGLASLRSGEAVKVIVRP